MLEADIAQLKDLAATLDSVAGEIDKIDVRTSGDKLAEALPGCSLTPVCAQVGEFAEGAWLRVAQRMQQLSRLVTESANAYEMTDDEFKRKLDTMDFTSRGES